MKDPFPSDQRVGRVSAPVLVLHGVNDDLIHISYGERLFELIRAPKRFIRLANASHNDHDEHGGFEAVRSFLLTGVTER